jgi:hypothetical protein
VIFASVLESIGNTPHIRINRLFDPRVTVWAKQERLNPGGSIKDRIALDGRGCRGSRILGPVRDHRADVGQHGHRPRLVAAVRATA